MRFLTAGDSHGEYLVGIIEGFAAGHRIRVKDIDRDLARRRQSYGRSARQKIEQDRVSVVSGLWKGRTTGAPIAFFVQRLDEVPPISERASARGTALRVAAGAIARGVLKLFCIDVLSHTISIGGINAAPAGGSFDSVKRRAARSSIYCADRRAEKTMIDTIKQAKKDGNSLGGAVELIATGTPPGLGSHVAWDRKLDARLAGALMSVQSVKAVELGDGLETCTKKGFESHDSMHVEDGRVRRPTNFAGGIEGGMTNGEDIVARVYAKPLPTSPKRLPSVDMRGLKPATSPFVRSDVCVIPALGVIAEAVLAWEILVAFLEKFGGDSIGEITSNYQSYVAALAKRGIRVGRSSS